MLRRSFLFKLLTMTAACAGGAVNALRAAVNGVARYGMGIQIDKCIGCGRCYKVCAHEVLSFEEVDEDDSAKMFMKVEKPGSCVGCQACGRTCAKKAFTFAPVEM